MPEMKQKVVHVMVDDIEDIPAIAEIMDRTAKCLKACNQLTGAIEILDEHNLDMKAAGDAVLAFARKMLAIYPEGKYQCIAHQEMFRTVHLAERIKN